MNLFKRIFAAASPASGAAANSQMGAASQPSSQQSQSPAGQQNQARRELVRVVLRDTLNRTGIPSAWIGCDLLAATSRGREPGIHVRLLMKHWDSRLMLHGMSFQNTFYKRMLTMDPQAERWLLGISWQFALADQSKCPPMPHPGTWTSSVPIATMNAAAAVAAAALAAEQPAPSEDLLGGSIVISGPATASKPDSRADAKADLERLFAVRDQDMKRHADAHGGGSFAATEPGGLHNLPDSPMGGEGPLLQNSFAKTDVFKRPRAGAPAAEPGKTLTST